MINTDRGNPEMPWENRVMNKKSNEPRLLALRMRTRSELNASLSWPEELARWAFVWTVFVGMAIGIHRKSHIAIDLLRRNLDGRLKSIHTIFMQIVICTTSIALLKYGWKLAASASYVSPALEWHFRYLYSAVPCGVGASGGIGKVSKKDLKKILRRGAAWAVENGYGLKEDLEFCEEGGTMPGAPVPTRPERRSPMRPSWSVTVCGICARSPMTSMRCLPPSSHDDDLGFSPSHVGVSCQGSPWSLFAALAFFGVNHL